MVNLALGNKFQLNFDRNSNIFIQEKAIENVVCEMAYILSRPQCVNSGGPWGGFSNEPVLPMTTCAISLWGINIKCKYIYMRPRQNGRHFADYIFKCIFLE